MTNDLRELQHCARMLLEDRNLSAPMGHKMVTERFSAPRFKHAFTR